MNTLVMCLSNAYAICTDLGFKWNDIALFIMKLGGYFGRKASPSSVPIKRGSRTRPSQLAV